LLSISSAFYRFSSENLSLEVAALRDIHPGEEVSTNCACPIADCSVYLCLLWVDAYLGMPHEVRKKYLLDNWGFDCTCSQCSASEEDIADSDARRYTIVQIREDIDKAREEKRTQDAIALAKDLVTLYREEELGPLVPEAHYILAGLHLQSGDVEQAREFGQKALEARLKYYGAGNHRVLEAQQFLNELGT